MRKIIRIADLIFCNICFLVFVLSVVGSVTVPDEIVRYENDSQRLSVLYSYSSKADVTDVDLQSGISENESLKLLRVIPVKTVRVTSKKSETVYVSGEAFGIKLYTDGVIVVGTQSVDTKDGKRINPAQSAGIETGDIIVSVNNIKVYSAEEVRELLNDNNGEPFTVKLKRDGRYKTFSLRPEYSYREGCYKAGMWVRDSTAGIGTITFYNDNNGSFAALGHQINDIDTGEIMPLQSGEAVATRVSDVQKATSSEAGSLVCDFLNMPIGELKVNSSCGLYGRYNSVSEAARPMKVASMQEVRKGRAAILTTVDAGAPKEYEIEILHISYNKMSAQKDIVFKVTDEELLTKTGGIVQGMSGSPIIQNGKLVGTVTHVIVNNPEKGYAVFAQTMLEKSNGV